MQKPPRQIDDAHPYLPVDLVQESMEQAGVELAEAKDINFEDTETAFRYKSNAQLKRALTLLKSIQNSFLVNIGPGLVNFALRNGFPIKGMLRTYFFDQFCGGTDLEDTQETITNLYLHGCRSVLDFAVEAEKTEAGFDRVFDEVSNLLDFAKAHDEVAFVAAKMTGLGNFNLMAKKQAGKPLSKLEKEAWARMEERLETLCEKAANIGQSIYIDAEESWIQDEVDRMVERMMMRYNKEAPIVYTTVQMYRHDRLQYLKELFRKIRLQQAIPGVKLVRGAYLEKENERAQKKGYPTPMQPTKYRTDRDFDKALRYIIERAENFGVCIGSHNEYSSLLAVQLMNEQKVLPDNPNIYFSQLYGMGDHISFNLAKEGFNVAKYLPYGPIQNAVPYLFRRAQENSSVKGQSSRELELIRRELDRRATYSTFSKFDRPAQAQLPEPPSKKRERTQDE
mgnify:CR=1 FL=1